MPTTRRQAVASAIASLVCLTFMAGAHLPHQQHRPDQTAVLDTSRSFSTEVGRSRPYRDLTEITTTTTVPTPTTSPPIPTRTRVNPKPPSPTAPSPRATPAPTVRTPTTVQRAISSNADIWACLREHESGGDYRKNTGNGYYGAYQFSISTWNSMGTGYDRADHAPPAVQDDAAQRLQARSGWSQWPQTSRMCGVR